MSYKTITILVVVVAALAYATGRYIQPAKVITEVEVKTEIVEVEVEKTKTEVRTIVKEVIKPDGTKETTTTTENIAETKKKNKKEAQSERKELKIVEGLKPQWKAQVLIGLENIEIPSYRVGVERRIVGPIFAGAYSNTNFQEYGLSVSMEF
jgi:hypothetical protein